MEPGPLFSSSHVIVPIGTHVWMPVSIPMSERVVSSTRGPPKSCSGIRGSCLPGISHFGEFPLSHPTPGHNFKWSWREGDALSGRDPTEQTFISELWHKQERRKGKAGSILFLHFAFHCNYSCRNIFKHQKGGNITVALISHANCIYMLTAFLRDNYLITSALIFSIFSTQFTAADFKN